MLQRFLRFALFGLGVLAGLLVILICVVRIGGPALRRKVFFSMISGTTDPMSLLNTHVPAGQHISYGSDALQFGELRVPTGPGPFPVAILVHGGCWKARLRQAPPEATSPALLRPLSAALAEAGVATWSVEYRRMGNPGGGWPGSYLDLGNAADFLKTLARNHPLDLSKVIVIGHSSGGQLAMWLGSRHKLSPKSPLFQDSPLPILGILDLDGPPDLVTASDWDQTACGEPVVKEFMGGSPEQVADRYHDGSAASLLPLGIRQVLLYSAKTEFMAKDEQKWAIQFLAYKDKATQAGDIVDVDQLTQAGHFDGLNPRSKSWPEVLAKVRSLLNIS
jgi:acetyl esterase/lipase